MEADFGHIHVDFPDGRRLVPFLVTAWAYSNAPFVLALAFERTEAILEGMVAAFEFFGGVPEEVSEESWAKSDPKKTRARPDGYPSGHRCRTSSLARQPGCSRSRWW